MRGAIRIDFTEYIADEQRCSGVARHFEDEESRKKLAPFFWWSGFNEANIPTAESFGTMLDKADMVGIQDSGLWATPSAGAFTWWGRSYIALQHLKRLERQYCSGNAIYKAAVGPLFSALRGKRVAVVGGKAALFKDYFYGNAVYRESFPFLALDEWELTASIVTPDFHQGLFESREEIEREIRASYGKADVYLFACGTLAKYLAVQAVEEAEVSAIDIGGVLSAMMNLPPTRPYMSVFETFQHPEKKFVCRGMVVDKVEDRPPA